jgi:hypothetical protein
LVKVEKHLAIICDTIADMEKGNQTDIEKLKEKYAKADFLSLMYPDKEALKGVQVIDDLLEYIISGEVQFDYIDREALLYFGGLEGAEHEEMLKKSQAEFLKIKQYASEISGVSLDRIRAAEEFWHRQLTE